MNQPIPLCVCTRADISAKTVGDVIGLIRRHPELKFLSMLGIYIGELRDSAASMALQIGASHLLFIDSDMRVPVTTLDQLLAPGLDIVAANTVMRTMQNFWNARAYGQMLSSQDRAGLEEVESVGCGAMLIRTRVFQSLPRPWFATPYEDSAHAHIGEDRFFCRKARMAGFKIWIDHDLSQDVRHQGTIELGVQVDSNHLESTLLP